MSNSTLGRDAFKSLRTMSLTVSVSFFRVRRLYAHIIVHLAFLLCCQAVWVVIDDSSPRVVYNTPVLQESTCKFQRGNADCDGHWWSESGDSRGLGLKNNSVHTTYGPLTKAVLEFQGKSVTLYGIKLVQFGAKVLITLDDDSPTHVDCNLTALSNDVTLATEQPLFSRSGLDPLVPHRIIVAYDDSTFDPTNRAWMSIDYFEVDEPPEGSSTTQGAESSTSPAPGIPSSPASGTASGSSTSTGRSAANAAAIVGGVLGGLAGVLLAVSAGLWLRRRRLRKGAEQMVSPLPIQAENPRSMPSAKTAGQSDASPSSIGALAAGAPASLPPPYSHNPVVAYMSRRLKG